MKSSRLWAGLILLVLTAVAAPVWAAGPLDAGFQLTLTAETGESFVVYLVMMHNDAQAGFALLDPELGEWYYGFGTLDGNQRMTGALFYFDTVETGQFDLRFQNGTVTGTITFVFVDVPFAVSGSKFF